MNGAALRPPAPPPSALPLVEIVAEIGCELGAPSDLARFAAVVAAERSRYPISHRRVERHTTAGLREGDDVVVTEHERLLGQVMTDANGLEIHALVDSFSARCTGRFEDWPTLATEGTRMWAQYRDTVAPVRLTHVAVRYIMHVAGLEDARLLCRHIRFAPEFPARPAGPVSSYFAQMGAHDDAVDAEVTIVVALAVDDDGVPGLRLESHLVGSIAAKVGVDDTADLVARQAQLDEAQRDICAGLLVGLDGPVLERPADDPAA